MAAQDKNNGAIQRFWEWFAERSTYLSSLHSSGHTDRLATLINGQLDKINPQLAWELGPGKNTKNSLTTTGEGNPSLRLLAEQMITAAPKLGDWELYATKQPREAPSTIRLPERNLELSTLGVGVFSIVQFTVGPAFHSSQ
jgi:hypothetical protein